MVDIMLYFTVRVLYFYCISISLNVCACECVRAAHNMAAFCISLISCFPGMFLRYFLNDFEMVPVDPVSFVFTFQMRFISVVRSLNFRVFSALS